MTPFSSGRRLLKREREGNQFWALLVDPEVVQVGPEVIEDAPGGRRALDARRGVAEKDVGCVSPRLCRRHFLMVEGSRIWWPRGR